MPRYAIKISGREYDLELSVGRDQTTATVDGKTVKVWSERLGQTRTLLSIDHRTYEVDIHPNGNGSRLIFLRGFDLEATIEDYNLAQLKKTAGFSDVGAMETKLKAAMPGLVVEIKVAPGDKVTKGMPVVVLEAMKMENVIKAKGDATVKSIGVQPGAAVEKGDTLLEFE